MKLVAPSAALAPFVRAFMLVEVDEETTHLRLPELGLVLGVRDRGAASVLDGESASRLPDAMLSGMTSTARLMRTSARGRITLALFRPGGAAAFFPQPLHELFGQTSTLLDLVPRADVERLSTRIAEASDDATRVAALESMLLERCQTAVLDPVVAAAVRALEEARGAVRIGALARHLGISQDPLEKRFRRAVGATPKQLASLLRLRHALEAWRPGSSLAELAQQAGYFDQSHFTRELRAVTGQPPGRFLRSSARR
ncbi:helix-turn-helix domain-containing protein [Sorangium atrum]|uniref:Helix-turn-helix transcriptional regulator n=1 Tax=Sorangium atrum TaxID=2995308 RepID=A0ABT5BVU6_9BACT|nr:helix-turn-helix transcriptional regulator [Sorangium aterium]MDC0678266.1 helix-turn-helix transcriptional regulator [Sorangium aterium]